MYLRIITVKTIILMLLLCVSNILMAKDIYLLIGQSNMVGRAPIELQDRDTIYNTSLLSMDDSWVPATNPLNRFSTIEQDPSRLAGQGIGPGYMFASTITRVLPDTSLGLVVNARGATQIIMWQKGATEGYYEEAVKRTKAALALSPNHVLRGILWHQGEGDKPTYLSYITRFKQMVTDFRNDFGIEDLPVFLGQIGMWKSGNDDINMKIEQIPDSVEYAYYVSAKELTPLEDNTHFNARSQRLLGERYAAKVLEVVYKIEHPIHPMLTTNADHGSVRISPQKSVYDSDDIVSLSAIPDEGYVFSHWSGDARSNQNPLDVLLITNKNITANFLQAQSGCNENNLLTNPDFENGITGWTGIACVISANTSTFFDGFNSLRIATRTSDMSGARQDITTILNMYGQGRYKYAAMFTKTSGTTARDAELVVSLWKDGTMIYEKVSGGKYNTGTWSLIEGIADLEWSGDLDSAFIQTRTPGNSNSYHIDNCNFSRVCLTSTNSPKLVDSQVSFYPNPANTNLTVVSKGDVSLSEIELFDLKGIRVSYIKSSAFVENLSVSSLSDGIYLLRVKTSDQIFNGRIVINKD